MRGPQLSVIVPVYQAGAYLRRCVESILAQEADLELILVDDGSTDGSAALCDALAAEDGRVRVLHQANGGVSAARNAGMEAARGEYLQFVDADDTIGADYSKDLIAAAEAARADLTIAGYTHCYGEGREVVSHGRQGGCTIEALIGEFEPLYRAVLLNSPVNKLYRRALVRAPFPAGMRMGEDFIFNMRYLEGAKTIAWCENCSYYYEQGNAQSATTRRVVTGLEDVFAYAGAAGELLRRHLPAQEAEKIYDRVLFLRLCTSLNSLASDRERPGMYESFCSSVEREDVRRMLRAVQMRGMPWSKRAARLLMRRGGIRILWKLMGK